MPGAAALPSRHPQASSDLDFLATLLQKRQQRLHHVHLRFRPTAHRVGVVHYLLLDCSASMVNSGALAQAKGWLQALFKTLRREHATVCLICFGGGEAVVKFGPAPAQQGVMRWLDDIGGGGGTPLALGLECLQKVQAQRRHLSVQPHDRLLLLSDGLFIESGAAPAGFADIAIVDFEIRRVPLGGAARLATQWGALLITP